IFEEETVRRLHVAVQYTESMGGLQTVDHFQDTVDRFARRQGPALPLDLIFEGGAGHQFHDDVRPARVLIGGIDEDAARMIDLAGEPPLLAESLHLLRIVAEPRREKLDGDAPPGVNVDSLANGAHAAGTKLRPEAIVADQFREPFRDGPRRRRLIDLG